MELRRKEEGQQRSCNQALLYMISLFDLTVDRNGEEFVTLEWPKRERYRLRERAGGGDGGASQAREVVTIGSGDPFDHAEEAAVSALARAKGREAWGSKAIRSARRRPWILSCGRCMPAAVAARRVEEVQALDRPVALAPLVGQARERALSGAVIVQRGQILQVAAIASREDLAQIDQAVDGFLQRRQLPRLGLSRCSTLRWC